MDRLDLTSPEADLLKPLPARSLDVEEIGGTNGKIGKLVGGCSHLIVCGEFPAPLDGLDAQIIVRQDAVAILIDPTSLLDLLMFGGAEAPEGLITLTVAVQIRRRGHELKLVYTAPEARPPMRDDRLIHLLGQGRIAYQQLRSKR
jgi:hypothetical protein